MLGHDGGALISGLVLFVKRQGKDDKSQRTRTSALRYIFGGRGVKFKGRKKGWVWEEFRENMG